MYSKNIKGPKIEPCGTPHTIFLDDEVWPLMEHTCSLSVMYRINTESGGFIWLKADVRGIYQT